MSLTSALAAGLPILRWRHQWRQPGTVRADLLAGLTNAVVVLPQGIAFATLAGMPPQYGLYAAMVPCLVAALFGSSRLMVTGPANAISLTTLALVSPLAAVGSADYVRLVITLTLMVGVLQLLLGIARVGKLVERVPHSVVVGFTAGAAILIANSQLGPLLGLALPRGTGLLANIGNAWSQAAQAHPGAIACAGATIAAALAWQRWGRWLPAMLVAVLAGAFVAVGLRALFPWLPPLAAVQPLPGALPPLSMPDLSPATLQALVGPALVMTLLGLTEAIAIAKAVALRHGDRLDGNQEFVAQGLANVAGSFFSAYPSSGSFNRSGVNLASGARTPLAAASAALFLVGLLLLVSPLVKHLPLAAIAGLLVLVAYNLFNPREVAATLRNPQDRWPALLTFFVTVFYSLEWAMVIGIAAAALLGLRARRGG
ncbi:MAG TPA: SulP family inorganic anion transporter [Ramlibacter sp.]|nr:SulP family inorganic anion transporter [Ramlibacter sp.]